MNSLPHLFIANNYEFSFAGQARACAWLPEEGFRQECRFRRANIAVE